ncbi:MAG: tripartite tricarboxylate transporter substrate binding protein [Alphaproteobacteria bacterium]|nr:tripartite tricarboxylate transporter substrate binding protein [Alphaproteobacteria bacterium]
MIRTPRRQLLKLATVLATSAAWPAAAQTTGQTTGQTTAFPARPIRLIVPHAAGGNSDAFGRILAQFLGERVGQQVVVENKPGAGGTVASGTIAKGTAPDGYTLLVADNGTHAIAPTLYGAKLSYDVFRDFTPITLAATFPAVIVLHPSVQATTAQEFVALAKSQPGKFTYSSAGTGNGSHLTMELFRTAAGGLDMLHVPYKGGAPAVQALLAGEVQLTAVSVNTALPHIQSGKVRALGVASSKRSPALPDVPTFAESGILFEGDSWLAIVGPPGTPADIVAKLNADIAATLRQPDVQERLAKIGLAVVASTPAELTAVLQRDVPKWGKAVKESGAVAE